MRFPGRGKNTSAVDVRQIVLAALASALEDGRQSVKDDKKGLTTVRAVAAGATLVTAGRAVYKGTKFVRERLGSDDAEQYEDEEYEDEEYEEYEDEEPEAEADEEVRGRLRGRGARGRGRRGVRGRTSRTRSPRPRRTRSRGRGGRGA